MHAMGIPEISYRVGQVLSGTFEKFGCGLVKNVPEPSGVSGMPHIDITAIANMTNPQPYVAAADNIMSGNYSIFALRGRQLGFPPEWNRDPKTSTLAPATLGKSLNYRDESLVGDIKYLWEVNRHLELVTLAQAYACSSNIKYLEGIRIVVDSWVEQCPYPFGVNWTSSLEQAVRLVNWAVTWHLIGGDDSKLFQGAKGALFKRKWLNSIYQHLHFIRGHLSKYSSANNHLLGEYMGLYIGSVTWPLWKEATEWREFSGAGFSREVLIQNGSDGVNKEQGIWYHHEVADMMLFCGLIGRAGGYEFPVDYWNRLESMLEFIASVMDVSGNMPMIGDSDDALMVRFIPGNFHVYRSLLATGAVIFERSDFKHKAETFDDKSLWLLGVEGKSVFDALPETGSFAAPPRAEFEEGGYCVFGSDLGTAREIRIVADAGPLGYLSIAAHGHADALAFTLSVSGNEIFIDPGTYAYHTQQKWRDYFRGTSAHNTVCVDGIDQSESGGNFLWLNHAEARCLSFEALPEKDVWEAEHTGYRRLRDPVTHRRQVEFDKPRATLAIVDTLECEQAHEIDINWHLSEQCEVKLDGEDVIICHGSTRVVMSMPGAELRVELLRGSEDPPMGWISRSFDLKTPIYTVRWHGSITGSASLKTIINIDQPGSEN
jgi:hypothetical protein